MYQTDPLINCDIYVSRVCDMMKLQYWYSIRHIRCDYTPNLLLQSFNISCFHYFNYEQLFEVFWFEKKNQFSKALFNMT